MKKEIQHLKYKLQKKKKVNRECNLIKSYTDCNDSHCDRCKIKFSCPFSIKYCGICKDSFCINCLSKKTPPASNIPLMLCFHCIKITL